MFLIPVRWIVHGIFLSRMNLLIRPNYIARKMNNEAEAEFQAMRDCKYGLNTQSREKKIIVSLTTIPSRVDKVRLVVSRIMNQTVKPDKIILYLDKEKKEEITFSPELNILIERGLEIEYVEDIGPHTKYFYSTQKYSDDIVITVDDDIIYSRKLIETLIKSYRVYPKAVSANIVVQFLINDGKPISSSEWLQQFKYGLGNEKSVAYGVGGVLYPPKVLPKEAFNIDKIRKLSLFQDDLWLKAIETKYKIDVVKARGGDKLFGYFVTVDGSQEITLRSKNDDNDRNVKYLNQLNEEFQLWKV